jgi:transposase
MASITKQRVGKYTYLYESISFRDEWGRPRNKKTKIGKIEPASGERIYTQEYMKRTPGLAQTPEADLRTQECRAEWDAAQQILDSVKDYGVFWFLKAVAEKAGLWNVLQEALPSVWKEVFTLVCYLIASDKAVMYCEDWVSDNEGLDDVGNMSSQRVSDLLVSFGDTERKSFYRQWCKHIREKEYIALDITSVSSYSRQIRDCEWGHNRDNEKLPQINLCMLFGEKSRLPVYQTNYSGSLGDVCTLETTMSEFNALLGVTEAVIVMDKGFFSAGNVNMLFEKGIRFLVSMPFTSKFVRQQVESERKDIDQIANVIRTSGAPIRGIHKIRAWGEDGKKLHVHVYFDPEKALKERNDIFNSVTRLKEIAMENPESDKYKDEIRRWLIVRKSERSGGYSINIREDVVAKSLETAGWFVLVSNYVEDAQEAFDIYRMKDVVEKGFWKYKNSLGLDRLRVHGDERVQNKTFIAFIALILASYVHKVMKDKELYKSMTFDRLFIILAKLKCAVISGHRVLRPLTKQQKDLFNAFDIPPPTSL